MLESPFQTEDTYLLCCSIVFANTWETSQHAKKRQFGTKGHTSRIMHKPGVIMRREVGALPQGEDLNENGDGGSGGNFPLSAAPCFTKPASFTSCVLRGCLCFQTMGYSQRRKQQDERSETLIIQDERRVGEGKKPDTWERPNKGNKTMTNRDRKVVGDEAEQ